MPVRLTLKQYMYLVDADVEDEVEHLEFAVQLAFDGLSDAFSRNPSRPDATDGAGLRLTSE
jgi:hypothetical protein